MADPDKRLRCAILIDHAGYVAPSGDRLGLGEQTHLVTLLNWASSPYVKRLNIAFVLIDPRLTSISERLSSNPHVASLEVPLPAIEERTAFLDAQIKASGKDIASFSEYTLAELGKLTAGIGLTDLEVLVRSTLEGGRRLDRTYFKELKKRPSNPGAGQARLVEPTWGLDTVVGPRHRRKRLLATPSDQRGELETVRGYCSAARSGPAKSSSRPASPLDRIRPCVKNFRSKYVGETAANSSRLGVLRSRGPCGDRRRGRRDAR